MSRIIKPAKNDFIHLPGEEVKDYVKENLMPPKHIRFHEVFEAYLTRHLQRFPAFEQNVNKETITEIRDFIRGCLKSLFKKSSSNDAVTDTGIEFITNVYMGHLKINNIEGIILPIESPQKLANELSKQELRLYSDIFKETEIGDICDNILASK